MKKLLFPQHLLPAADRDRIAGALAEAGKKDDVLNCTAAELPTAEEMLKMLGIIEALIFPGVRHAGRPEPAEPEKLLEELYAILAELAQRSVCHACRVHGESECDSRTRGERAAMALLEALPELRETARLDVEAAFVGDPAAGSYEDIVVSYPCVKAILTQRIAHVLYREKIPLLPRMLTEYAHSVTGIDINPGATIGKGFFIDHGTGVVVGETAVIGNNVRIYQGVTLGALSFPKDSCGMLVKGLRRHPTIEDDVTIYAGATVLGDITIGAGSIIGGNVWLTESLPPGTKISIAQPEQHIAKRGGKRG